MWLCFSARQYFQRCVFSFSFSTPTDFGLPGWQRVSRINLKWTKNAQVWILNLEFFYTVNDRTSCFDGCLNPAPFVWNKHPPAPASLSLTQQGLGAHKEKSACMFLNFTFQLYRMLHREHKHSLRTVVPDVIANRSCFNLTFQTWFGISPVCSLVLQLREKISNRDFPGWNKSTEPQKCKQ